MYPSCERTNVNCPRYVLGFYHRVVVHCGCSHWTLTILVKGDFLFSFSSSSGALEKKQQVFPFYRNGRLLLTGSRRVPQNVSQLWLRVSQLPPVTHFVGPFSPWVTWMSHVASCLAERLSSLLHVFPLFGQNGRLNWRPPPFDVPSLKLFVCVASRCRRRKLMTLSPDTSAVLFFFHSCIVKPNRPQSDINWMRNTQAVSKSKVAEATLTPTWTNTGTLFRSGNYFKPDF